MDETSAFPQDQSEALRMSAYAELACGQMREYELASLAYADYCEEQGDDARALRRRKKAQIVRTPGLLWPRPGLLPELSSHQQGELRKALARPLGLLTGTPGTGKTYAVASVVAWLYERHGSGDIAVCAPTGKAAVRITEAIQAHGVNLRARTIHSLLEIGRNGHDGRGWGFLRNAKRPLDERFVITDEASMLDTSLAASLLAACRTGTHILLVGDPNQLPPVGHGAPLRDLIAAGAPCGCLTEIQRNAGLIVEACAKIKDGQPFEVAPGISQGNLHVIERRTPEEQAEALEQQLISLGDWTGEELDPIWDCQVIVAVNSSGILSRDSTNKRLQALLNPSGARVEGEPGNPYRTGDKVICLKNGAYEGEETEHYLANGEIGQVISVEPGRADARFDNERTVRIYRGRRTETAAGANEFDLAYAITAHKSQGSEWPVVFVMLDSSPGAARVAGREWLYTAVSRARRRCFLVGKLGVAQMMSKRPSLESRRTFLREAIWPQ